MSVVIRARFFVRKLSIIALVLILGISSLTPPVRAATAVTTFNVSATVLSACIVVATDLLFGVYTSSNSSPTTNTSLVTVTCTLGTTYTVALNAGTGTGATFSNRVMLNSTNALNYNLYTNSNHTTVWGDGTGSTSTNGATAGLLPAVYTVYGQIPAGQYAAPGTYADVITATVSY